MFSSHKGTSRQRMKDKARVGGKKTQNRTESGLRCRRATREWSQVKWWLGSGCFSRTPPWFAVWSGCRGLGRQWRPPSVNWHERGCAYHPLSPCWRQSECGTGPIGSYRQWALRESRETSNRAENMYRLMLLHDSCRILSEGHVLHRKVRFAPGSKHMEIQEGENNESPRTSLTAQLTLDWLRYYDNLKLWLIIIVSWIPIHILLIHHWSRFAAGKLNGSRTGFRTGYISFVNVHFD